MWKFHITWIRDPLTHDKRRALTSNGNVGWREVEKKAFTHHTVFTPEIASNLRHCAPTTKTRYMHLDTLPEAFFGFCEMNGTSYSLSAPTIWRKLKEMNDSFSRNTWITCLNFAYIVWRERCTNAEWALPNSIMKSRRINGRFLVLQFLFDLRIFVYGVSLDKNFCIKIFKFSLFRRQIFKTTVLPLHRESTVRQLMEHRQIRSLANGSTSHCKNGFMPLREHSWRVLFEILF